MKIHLIQHGEAKPEAEDPERSLTARGEEEVSGDESARVVLFRYGAIVHLHQKEDRSWGSAGFLHQKWCNRIDNANSIKGLSFSLPFVTK